jgi:PPOX class probable FMN-dependent enzyme
MVDPHRITTAAELREVIAAPSAIIEQKVFEQIDEYAAAFIARSPLVLLATANARGELDVSPKGDAPGFVVVDDPQTLLLPDRPGNRLAYGFHNILEQPRVGLIFLVPGVSETLRVNGDAEITRDPALRERLTAGGKPAVLVTRIRVRECFFHCGKAFIRSALWKPESWPIGVKAEIGKQFARVLRGDAQLADAIDAGLADDYAKNLY